MKKIVDQTNKLNTINTLARDLRALGVKEGSIILVHSSLSSIGWVNGGPTAVIAALMNVVTPSGALVMPTQSGELSEPSKWGNPPVPEAWWEDIRQTMPAFNEVTTPTSGMGQIAEAFRSYPGVSRSNHPAVSFAAWGKEKAQVLANHSIDFGLGEESPLAKLYQLNAQILFIGTGYDTNTAFHLGEYRAPGNQIVLEGAPIIKNEKRVWQIYQDIEFQEEEFEQMGHLFDQQHQVNKGLIGQAESRLFSLKEAVDYAKTFLREKRTQ